MNYENIAGYFIRGTVGTPSYWPAIYIDRIKESGHRLFFPVKNVTAYLKFHLPFSSFFFFLFSLPTKRVISRVLDSLLDFENPTEVKARGVDAISHKHAQCEG